MSAESGGLDEVLRNLNLRVAAFEEGARLACAEIAALLEAYAKLNHEWGNPYSKGYVPTGFTNASTHGTWEQLPDGLFRVVLSAGMDYDVFLELARQGKWAWLWPCMEANVEPIRAIFDRRLAL